MATSDEFVVDRTLGEGAFGKVFLVTGCGDGLKYAMKVIDLKKAPDEERELAVREANLLRDLRHVNVLQYTDSFESEGALCIVTEYCENGDLSEFLDQRNKSKIKLEEDRLTDWFKQIASALKYLHGKKIVHRDVKTPNVFLTQSWQAKLGDMGLAKVLEKPSQMAVTFCGSPYYMSPEIFSCKPYGAKSDIWALGVIVYEMATLERPFNATLMHQLVYKIVHGGLPEMPTGYNPELCKLLGSMMQKEPEKRPSAEDILDHQFFVTCKPPPQPPKRAPDAVGGAIIKSRYNIKKGGKGGKEKHMAGPFAMENILGTLSRIRLERKQAEEKKGEGRDKDAGFKGIQTIIAKKDQKPKTSKFTKNLGTTVRKSQEGLGATEGAMGGTVASLSNVHLTETTGSSDSFERTLIDIQEKTATEAFDVMQLIVRTMTGIFSPDRKDDAAAGATGRADPQAAMLRQIEHLQYYCTKVLNDDVALMTRAYEMLAKEKDERKLEEKLIQILGPEKFGLCGVQLMFLRNFEYNLNKMQK